jgi:hypothetical protein
MTFVSPLVAQNVRVNVARQTAAIPKGCESVVPAPLDGTRDLRVLAREAICKGAGDMIIEYSYVLSFTNSERNRKGTIKETNMTYEVFVPTLKSGARTRSVLVLISRNGVPTPPDKLQKDRQRAAEQIEKEEAKIGEASPTERNKKPNTDRSSQASAGILPLGMYARSTTFQGGAVLNVATFLTMCDLTLLRRAPVDGRETLVFKFTPRPGAQLSNSEKYIAQLTGEIWIDVKDHIVTRLVGRPAESVKVERNTGTTGERPPAVYVEMLRLDTGVWLPRVSRINGAGYPWLFAGVSEDSTATFSNYIRFSTEVQDVKIDSAKKPQ